jgi:hypothetical protein
MMPPSSACRSPSSSSTTTNHPTLLKTAPQTTHENTTFARRMAALITTPRSALKNAHQARPFSMPRASSTAAGVVEGSGAAPEKKQVRGAS